MTLVWHLQNTLPAILSLLGLGWLSTHSRLNTHIKGHDEATAQLQGNLTTVCAQLGVQQERSENIETIVTYTHDLLHTYLVDMEGDFTLLQHAWNFRWEIAVLFFIGYSVLTHQSKPRKRNEELVFYREKVEELTNLIKGIQAQQQTEISDTATASNASPETQLVTKRDFLDFEQRSCSEQEARDRKQEARDQEQKARHQEVLSYVKNWLIRKANVTDFRAMSADLDTVEDQVTSLRSELLESKECHNELRKDVISMKQQALDRLEENDRAFHRERDQHEQSVQNLIASHSDAMKKAEDTIRNVDDDSKAKQESDKELRAETAASLDRFKDDTRKIKKEWRQCEDRMRTEKIESRKVLEGVDGRVKTLEQDQAKMKADNEETRKRFSRKNAAVKLSINQLKRKGSSALGQQTQHGSESQDQELSSVLGPNFAHESMEKQGIVLEESTAEEEQQSLPQPLMQPLPAQHLPEIVMEQGTAQQSTLLTDSDSFEEHGSCQEQNPVIDQHCGNLDVQVGPKMEGSSDAALMAQLEPSAAQTGRHLARSVDQQAPLPVAGTGLRKSLQPALLQQAESQPSIAFDGAIDTLQSGNARTLQHERIDETAVEAHDIAVEDIAAEAPTHVIQNRRMMKPRRRRVIPGASAVETLSHSQPAPCSDAVQTQAPSGSAADLSMIDAPPEAQQATDHAMKDVAPDTNVSQSDSPLAQTAQTSGFGFAGALAQNQPGSAAQPAVGLLSDEIQHVQDNAARVGSDDDSIYGDTDTEVKASHDTDVAVAPQQASDNELQLTDDEKPAEDEESDADDPSEDEGHFYSDPSRGQLHGTNTPYFIRSQSGGANRSFQTNETARTRRSLRPTDPSTMPSGRPPPGSNIDPSLM